jgi:hypothetical protein
MVAPLRPMLPEGPLGVDEEAGPLPKQGGRRRDRGTYLRDRPVTAMPRRWALAPVVVAVLAGGSLVWSLMWGAGLASDLGQARAEVRQLRGAGVELRLARSSVASLKADVAGGERLLQAAQVCIGGLATSIERLVDFDTDEGLSWWRAARPNCDRVMNLGTDRSAVRL